jgi:hypothetical protein
MGVSKWLKAVLESAARGIEVVEFVEGFYGSPALTTQRGDRGVDRLDQNAFPVKL